jgi:hypothetical protein
MVPIWYQFFSVYIPPHDSAGCSLVDEIWRLFVIFPSDVPQLAERLRMEQWCRGIPSPDIQGESFAWASFALSYRPSLTVSPSEDFGLDPISYLVRFVEPSPPHNPFSNALVECAYLRIISESYHKQRSCRCHRQRSSEIQINALENPTILLYIFLPVACLVPIASPLSHFLRRSSGNSRVPLLPGLDSFADNKHSPSHFTSFFRFKPGRFYYLISQAAYLSIVFLKSSLKDSSPKYHKNLARRLSCRVLASSHRR